MISLTAEPIILDDLLAACVRTHTRAWASMRERHRAEELRH